MGRSFLIEKRLKNTKRGQTQLLSITIFWGVWIKLSGEAEQFQEFIAEVKYAAGLVSKKKYNLCQYYNHMADFFDHIERTEDAQEHRILAKKWEIEKGDNNDN